MKKIILIIFTLILISNITFAKDVSENVKEKKESIQKILNKAQKHRAFDTYSVEYRIDAKGIEEQEKEEEYQTIQYGRLTKKQGKKKIKFKGEKFSVLVKKGKKYFLNKNNAVKEEIDTPAQLPDNLTNYTNYFDFKLKEADDNYLLNGIKKENNKSSTIPNNITLKINKNNYLLNEIIQDQINPKKIKYEYKKYQKFNNRYLLKRKFEYFDKYILKTTYYNFQINKNVSDKVFEIVGPIKKDSKNEI
ncbi:hypothetical protein ACFL2K_00710 [Candidatus Margulisiibacteriota bacterium]